MPCPKCGNREFDEDSGLGVQEWLPGKGGRDLKRSICDKCGLPKAEEELAHREVDLETFKELYPTVNFDDEEERLRRAKARLSLWKKLHESPNPQIRRKVEDAVAQAYEAGRGVFFDLRENAVTTCLVQGDKFLEDAGEVKVDNPKFQNDLDKLREGALEATTLARRDLELAQNKRTPFKRRVKLYKRAGANARAYLGSSRAYRRKQTNIDTKRLAAEVVERVSEEIEAGRDDVVEQTPETERPAMSVAETEPSEVDEGSSTKTIADLPSKVRIITFRKTKVAQDKEQKRARELLDRYGGVIMATGSWEAQIVAAAKANGSSIRVTQGKKKRKKEGKTA